MGRQRRSLAAACLAVGALAGTATPRTPGASSVILVTLDTTRADHVPPYGAPAEQMPVVADLASHGIVFDDAMTVAPLTLPAHCSLFTGLTPPAHGVRDNSDTLDGSAPTLAERLRANGFRTAAFVSSVVLGAEHGLARGFDVYSQPDGRYRRPANEVVDEALLWMASNRSQRYFVWVHLYDAHAPYAVPEPYRTRYASDPYSGALAFADSQIGRLREFARTGPPRERAGFVVTADHGESLGEHGEANHGIFVYQGTLHVPLILNWPGLAPRRVPQLVRLVDVMPTLLALEGTPGPPMDGVSLVPWLQAAPPTELDGYAESMYPRRFGWSGLRVFRAGRFKVIEAPRPELYDLETDADELHNMYEERPRTAMALLEHLQRTTRDGVAARASGNTAAMERALASLGYVAGARAATGPGALLVDPKDVIGQYNAILERTVARSGAVR